MLTKFLNKRDKFRSVTQGKNGITLCDTRSLGNRQFLVVAEYDQQKFLLGVSAGNIKLLSKLNSRVLPVGASSEKVIPNQLMKNIGYSVLNLRAGWVLVVFLFYPFKFL